MPNAPLYRIGFVATGARRTKTDASRFDKYFVGKYQGKRVLVNPNPTTYDTIAEIAKVSSECAGQVKPLATQVLMRPTVEETLKADWQFVYDYINYQEDRDEEIRDPLSAWYQKRGDCDCYATFLSALLICQGIEHYTDTVKMYHKDNFQHIFIVVPKNPRTFNPELDKNDKSKYWVLDPVVDSYNLEPDNITFKHLTKMGAPLYRISGVGNAPLGKSAVLAFGQEFDGFGQSLKDNQRFIQGLGCTADRSAAQAALLKDEFLQRLKVNLINTRNRLAQKTFSGKQQILDSYDRVIAAWDDETARKQELQKIEGLGNFLDKAKDALDDVGDAAKKALEEAQKAADEIAKKVKEGAAAVKSKAEEFADFLKKINPIGIAGRTTIFQIFRNNTGGAASRLKWAYATPEIFALSGQPAANQQKYKDKLGDIQKVIRAMGGTEMELQSAVFAGDSLPQKPTVAFNIQISDTDKKQILEAMQPVLKNEFQSASASAINTPVQVINSNNDPVLINPTGTQNGGAVAISQGTPQNTSTVDTTRRDVVDMYARPASAPPSPFVINSGVATVSVSSPGPMYSVQTATLKGIDDSIKDIWDKIWEFIRELGDDVGQFAKNFGEKAIQVIKTVAMAAPRAFFLLLLKFNVDGLATAIALDSSLWEDQWVSKFGGERQAFKNSLSEGAVKKPFVTKLMAPLAKYITGQASVKSISGLGNYRYRRYYLSGPVDEQSNDSSVKQQSGDGTLVNAGAKALETYAQAQKDNKDLKATLVSICTAVGTAIGAACGGYGAVLGAPVGAVVGGLISLMLGEAKKPDTTQDNSGSTTTQTTTNPDGSTTIVTKDASGNVIDSQTKDKDGNIVNPPAPPAKKSSILAWLGGAVIAAKLLFTSGALSGIDSDGSTEGIKVEAPEGKLTGKQEHIKEITI